MGESSLAVGEACSSWFLCPFCGVVRISDARCVPNLPGAIRSSIQASGPRSLFLTQLGSNWTCCSHRSLRSELNRLLSTFSSIRCEAATLSVLCSLCWTGCSQCSLRSGLERSTERVALWFDGPMYYKALFTLFCWSMRFPAILIPLDRSFISSYSVFWLLYTEDKTASFLFYRNAGINFNATTHRCSLKHPCFQAFIWGNGVKLSCSRGVSAKHVEQLSLGMSGAVRNTI